MKNRNVVVITLAVIVVSLLGSGCISLPRQKNVLPVSPIVRYTPQPQVEVAPTQTLQIVDTMASPLNDPRWPFLSSSNEDDSGNQQLSGRYKDNETMITQSPQPQPEKQFAAAPYLPPMPQRPHVHDTYPVFGQLWTHECHTCPEKIGLPTPTTYQSSAPQTYSQPLQQQQPTQPAWQQSTTQSDPNGLYEKYPILLAEQGRFDSDETIRYGNSGGHEKTFLTPNTITRIYGDWYYNFQKRKTFRTYPITRSYKYNGGWGR